MTPEEKQICEEADIIAEGILSKIKPKKEKCYHCFGQLDNPIFCHKIKGHKGEHTAIIHWEDGQ